FDVRDTAKLAACRVPGLRRIHAAGARSAPGALSDAPGVRRPVPGSAEFGGTFRERVKASTRSIGLLLIPQPQYAANHTGDAFPARGLTGQLFAADLGDRIELCLAVAFGRTP